jgi:hypothetical protein
VADTHSVGVALSPREEFSKALNGLHAACYNGACACRFCGVPSSDSHTAECVVGAYESACVRLGAPMFEPGEQYADPHIMNGKKGRRGPLFWFAASNREDWKDQVSGWLHEHSFNELADRLGLPPLEKTP